MYYQKFLSSLPEAVRPAVAMTWRWLGRYLTDDVPREGVVEVQSVGSDDGRGGADAVTLTITSPTGQEVTLRVHPRSVRLLDTRWRGDNGAAVTASLLVYALNLALQDPVRWRQFEATLDGVVREMVDWEAHSGDDDHLLRVLDIAKERFVRRYGATNAAVYAWCARVYWAATGTLRWCHVPVSLSSGC